ncbi:unnamed protein product [Calypogeia fissa]
MKIQCDSCEKKPASVVCCADEAALCVDCDVKIHGANKLAIKHQRVELLQPVAPTMCDICKEKSAFFFCISDRALLCRECDVAVHSKSELAKKHQRLFVTGAKAGLEALPHNNGESCSVSSASASSEVTSGVELGVVGPGGGGGGRHQPPPSPSLYGSSTAQRDNLVRTSIPTAQVLASPSPSSNWTALPQQTLAPPPSSLYKNEGSLNQSAQLGPSMPSYASRSMGMTHNNHATTTNRGGDGYSLSGHGPGQGSNHSGANHPPPEFDYSIGVEEFLGIPNISGYSFGDVASSKVDNEMFGNSFDWSPFSLADELQAIGDFHQVPSMAGPAPPAMGRGSAVMKGKGLQDYSVPDYDDGFVVPDMGYHSAPASPPVSKRRRQ